MSGPSSTYVRWQPQVRPETYEFIDVNEPSNVVLGAFGEDHLVDLDSLTPICEIPLSIRSAPEHVDWQRHDAMFWSLIGASKIIRQGHRPRPAIALTVVAGLSMHVSIVRSPQVVLEHPGAYVARSLAYSSVVDRSTTNSSSGGLDGNFVDGVAAQGLDWTPRTNRHTLPRRGS